VSWQSGELFAQFFEMVFRNGSTPASPLQPPSKRRPATLYPAPSTSSQVPHGSAGYSTTAQGRFLHQRILPVGGIGRTATYAEIKAGGFSEEVWEAHIHYQEMTLSVGWQLPDQRHC
jgi:hypothetical protein